MASVDGVVRNWIQGTGFIALKDVEKRPKESNSGMGHAYSTSLRDTNPISFAKLQVRRVVLIARALWLIGEQDHDSVLMLAGRPILELPGKSERAVITRTPPQWSQ